MDYAESTFQTRISLFANPSSYNSVLPTKTDSYNKIIQKTKPTELSVSELLYLSMHVIEKETLPKLGTLFGDFKCFKNS